MKGEGEGGENPQVETDSWSVCVAVVSKQNHDTQRQHRMGQKTRRAAVGEPIITNTHTYPLSTIVRKPWEKVKF